jgi:nucleotide-binding universal stress UspA family protein
MNILLAVDDSPAAAQALRLIAGYRGERARLALTALNVQRRAPQEGEREVQAARAVLAASDLACETAVRIGAPARAILEEASARRADLIVMGTRGRGGLSTLGSVAMRIAHGSHLPTILVKHDARLPAELGLRVRALVPVDGSDHALKAAARLASWSEWLSEITADLLYVQPQLPLVQALTSPKERLVEHWSGRESEQATRGAIEVLMRNAIQHQVHSVAGDPAQRIAQLAAEMRSDLVVMGTRGLGAAHHALLGSVALKVAELSPVPVALVP